MADLLAVDANRRVVAPESKTREYKRDLSSPDGLIKSVVAFANSAGGQLVLGVDDDGAVVGIADPFTEEERVANLIADSILPRLIPGIDLVTVADTTVLVVDVPLSTQRPHYLKSKGLDSGCYVRLGSTNRQADAPLIADIERSVRGIRYEDLTDQQATMADLDVSVLPAVDGRPVTEAGLVPLGLARREGGSLVPTNAGLLAAGPHPDRFMPSAWVQCGRIRGANRTDIVDRLEYHGPLVNAVEPVMDFLRKHAFLSAQFGEVRRKDVWSIPIDSLREVVVNALVHANYAEPGTHVRVVFYDDRIVVEGPGLLVAGMTIDGMRNASRLRNPALARIFRAAGLMENFGTGVSRVIAQLAEAGLPEPKIEEVVDRVRFTVYVPSHAPSVGPHRDHAHASSNVGRHVGRHDVGMLSAAVAGPVHRDALLAAAGLKPLSQNYARHVVPLIEGGLLAMTLPDKPRSKAQRYRITDAGRAFLEANQ